MNDANILMKVNIKYEPLLDPFSETLSPPSNRIYSNQNSYVKTSVMSTDPNMGLNTEKITFWD